jgi:predicted house-cleaning NTP pyrophosphatase (Maf/HAM1 superfamily)
MAAARVAVTVAGEKLRALASDAPPLQVAALADRLIAAAGEVYRHAHRVAEARSRR